MKIDDDTPLRLDVAARELFPPEAGITGRTLDRACKNGDLVFERLGKARLVTPLEVKRWRERFRSDRREPAFGSDQTRESGTSRTAGSASVQDALREMLQAQSGL